MLNRIFARPGLILLLFFGLVVFFGYQAQKFEINASADTLISEDNEQYIRSRQVSDRFAPEEFVLIAFRPKDGNVFSSESLDTIRKLTQRVEEIPRVASIRSILNVPLLSKADALSADLDPSAFTQEKLQLSESELAATFRGHPIYEGLIIDPEQRTTGLQILFKPNAELAKIQADILSIEEKSLDGELSKTDREDVKALKQKAAPLEISLQETRNHEIETLRSIIDGYQGSGDLYLGGVHVLGYQLIEIIQNDLLVFGGIIAVVICAMILLLFRRPQWLLITMTCCGASLVMTVGLFGLLGLQATVISSNFIALQLILTLAVVIHLLVQYRQDAETYPDLSQKDLVLRSLREKIAPCFFAGLTTSVGFASLVFSGIRPVSAFGWMMVIAMGVSVVTTLVLFPALLLFFSRPRQVASNSWITRPIAWLRRLCLSHSGSVLLVGVLLLVASVVGGLRLNVENSFINYFADDTDVHRELTFIDRDFGGSTPLDIIYTPPTNNDSDLVLRAKDVQNTHRIQDALDSIPAIGTTLSVVNFTELAKQINDNKPLTEYELSAVYLTLDEGIRKNLLGSFFVDPPAQLRISTRVKDSLEGLDRSALLDDIHKKIEALGIPSDQIELTNLFVIYQAMLQQLFESQILTLGIVFVALGLTFLLVFRSLPVALVAMAPNILSSLAVLGLMGWLGISLDFMTITIAAIAMGIAVDDTIHYTHRYLRELQDHDADTALKRAHHSVGFALVYTSVIIAIGFGLLAFSDFVPSVYFGLLTGFAILMALLTDLTLLPVLLRKFVPGKHPARELEADASRKV